MSNDSIYIVIGLGLVAVTGVLVWTIEEFKRMEDRE